MRIKITRDLWFGKLSMLIILLSNIAITSYFVFSGIASIELRNDPITFAFNMFLVLVLVNFYIPFIFPLQVAAILLIGYILMIPLILGWKAARRFRRELFPKVAELTLHDLNTGERIVKFEDHFVVESEAKVLKQLNECLEGRLRIDDSDSPKALVTAKIVDYHVRRLQIKLLFPNKLFGIQNRLQRRLSKGLQKKEINLAVFTELEELSLERVMLTELPDEISSLRQLRGLKLSSNHIEKLPPWIGILNQLEQLNLSNNRITELPETIGHLQDLRNLDLSRNHITELPESVCLLTKLKELDISMNPITTLPSCIDQMVELEAILATSTKIQHLSESLLQMNSLKELDLRGAPLDQSSIALLRKMLTLNSPRMPLASRYHIVHQDLTFKDFHHRYLRGAIVNVTVTYLILIALVLKGTMIFSVPTIYLLVGTVLHFTTSFIILYVVEALTWNGIRIKFRKDEVLVAWSVYQVRLLFIWFLVGSWFFMIQFIS